MHPAELAYYAKKAFALFPGGAEAASAYTGGGYA